MRVQFSQVDLWKNIPKIFDVFDYREYNKQAIDSFYREIN